MVDALMLAGVLSPMVSKSVARFWSRNELSRHIPLNISTCISNVPGPDFPLYCAGARMVDYYGLGVLTPGMGIFHLVFSYAGKITLSVLADRDIMPDPERYHDCLVASYEELYAAAIKLEPGRQRNAAVAAKAKIRSPKRKRTVSKKSSKTSTAGKSRSRTNAARADGKKTTKKNLNKPSSINRATSAKRTAQAAAHSESNNPA